MGGGKWRSVFLQDQGFALAAQDRVEVCRWGEISHVQHAVAVSQGRRTEYLLWIRRRDGLILHLQGTKGGLGSAGFVDGFEQMIDVVQQQATQLLAPSAIEEFQAGGTVAFPNLHIAGGATISDESVGQRAPLKVSHRGIEAGERVLPFDSLGRMELADGYVLILDREQSAKHARLSGAFRKAWFKTSFGSISNVFVLKSLIDAVFRGA